MKHTDAWAGGFHGRAADQRNVRVVFPLRASISAMPPSGPSLFIIRLRKRRRKVKRTTIRPKGQVQPACML